ncbi:nucleoside recognition domain-containing protein [Paenibacillus sp. OV219]|uniref:nucleoside recognition domain-containing protein n=1 Tax=Paenibacillus sp. OV219 TaxID=1884377 RepID=UPI0008BD7D09|nr:nucleoside recognition domain-containing protein [Paenibacillus sp. OV219]SEN29737.1 sporulation integral membrane protein YlbJ [Paenibacillus sp. OV219]
MTRTITYACLSILLVAAIIIRPDEAFQASLQGLTVWWNIVFPGLLPFLALLELMLTFGAVHALGTLLHPLMRRLFRLPGESGIAMALGWTGGFPLGAEAVASLRRSKLVTIAEGQRLLALSHMPSPLFMLLVVGSGFLHHPELGAAIAAAVWLSALLTSFVTAHFTPAAASAPASTRNNPDSETTDNYDTRAKQAPPSSLLRRASTAMQAANKRDGRTFGKALGDSVVVSVYKLMAIGGFMMFAAVLVRLLQPLMPENIPAFLLPAFLESHIGVYAAATTKFAGGIPWTAACCAAVLSWSGLSALLQAGGMLTGSGLSLARLAASRLVQSLLAFIITLLAWKPAGKLIQALFPTAAPAFTQTEKTGAATDATIRASDLHSLWPYTPVLLFGFLLAVSVLVMISTAITIASRAKRDPLN